jgi:multimeric flavodoxin WrbA
MRVVVLHGSQRRGGNSDTLVDRFLAGIGGSEVHDVSHFYAIEMRIAHCRGCGSCAAGRCAIDDDMQEVYPAFAQAEVVILAAPMFWGYMTSQLKTLFDRLEAVSGSSFSNKDFVLFVTYRHYYGSMVEWLGRISTGFGSRMHALTCQTYDPATERDVPVAAFPDKLQEAFDLGRKVASLPRLKAQ